MPKVETLKQIIVYNTIQYNTHWHRLAQKYWVGKLKFWGRMW